MMLFILFPSSLIQGSGTKIIEPQRSAAFAAEDEAEPVRPRIYFQRDLKGLIPIRTSRAVHAAGSEKPAVFVFLSHFDRAECFSVERALLGDLFARS